MTGQGVYPRPIQHLLPIRVGVGGTPESFARAGKLGLPLCSCDYRGWNRARFRPLVDYYRENARQAGHTGNNLEVSIHSIGFIADTSAQAADDFYPSYTELFNRIGKERGWPPITRAQFEASRGPTGALLVGDPESIAEKIVYEHNVLGGINQMTILLNGGMIPHRKTMRAIELLGTKVAPLVRKRSWHPWLNRRVPLMRPCNNLLQVSSPIVAWRESSAKPVSNSRVPRLTAQPSARDQVALGTLPYSAMAASRADTVGSSIQMEARSVALSPAAMSARIDNPPQLAILN